ncbi:hypothetical protein D9M71_700870 [compost metagenome]
MHCGHELTGFAEQLTNRLQCITGCWYWDREIPHSTRWAHQGIEQTRITGQSDQFFELIRIQPATLFIEFEFLLKGVVVQHHVKGKGGDSAFVITTSAIDRLTQWKDRTSVRQKICATHNRKSPVYGVAIRRGNPYPTTTTDVHVLCVVVAGLGDLW